MTQDYSQAIAWYSRAAEQGYAIAQINLGAYYYMRGTEEDKSRGIEYFKMAARQGDEVAKEFLAKLGVDNW